MNNRMARRLRKEALIITSNNSVYNKLGVNVYRRLKRFYTQSKAYAKKNLAKTGRMTVPKSYLMRPR